MQKYVHFNGMKFTRDEKNGYYLNSTNRIRLHRYVWEQTNGKIPEGYHIHHIDGDKNNNDISNLMMLTSTEHLSYHGNKRASEDYEAMVKNLSLNARPKANEWHASAEGRKWHKSHYEKMKDKLYVKREFTCEQCGQKFETQNNGANRFCSNKCKSKWRREAGLDDVERECIYCGRTFKINKYRKTRTCSRSCANKQRAQDRKNKKYQIS